MGVSSETYSVEGRPETWGVVSGDAGGHGGTHLNGAAVPGEDGSLALCGKEIGLALCELCAEYLCVTVDELGGVSGGEAHLDGEGRGGVELEAVLGRGEEAPFFVHPGECGLLIYLVTCW